ncbi:hypothetical protein Tco_1065676, partial [Tanacetum coccineum]
MIEMATRSQRCMSTRRDSRDEIYLEDVLNCHSQINSVTAVRLIPMLYSRKRILRTNKSSRPPSEEYQGEEILALEDIREKKGGQRTLPCSLYLDLCWTICRVIRFTFSDKANDLDIEAGYTYTKDFLRPRRSHSKRFGLQEKDCTKAVNRVKRIENEAKTVAGTRYEVLYTSVP